MAELMELFINSQAETVQGILQGIRKMRHAPDPGKAQEPCDCNHSTVDNPDDRLPVTFDRPS